MINKSIATNIGLLTILMWSSLALLSVFSKNIPPFLLLTLCFCISIFLVVLKRLYKREALLQLPSLNTAQWVVGVSGLFGFHFLYFLAIRHAPPIQVSLVCYLWPLLLALYVSLPGQRMLTLIGALLGFLGAGIVISGGQTMDFTPAYTLGYVYAFGAALIWSTYSWYMSKSDNNVEDIGWISLVVAVFALVCHLLLEENVMATPGLFDTTTIIAIILLGLGPVGGAFYLWDIAMKFGHKQWIASLSFTTPVISTILLAGFGIGSVSMNVLVSLGLIMAGAVLCNVQSMRRRMLHSQ